MHVKHANLFLNVGLNVGLKLLRNQQEEENQSCQDIHSIPNIEMKFWPTGN